MFERLLIQEGLERRHGERHLCDLLFCKYVSNSRGEPGVVVGLSTWPTSTFLLGRCSTKLSHKILI